MNEESAVDPRLLERFKTYVTLAAELASSTPDLLAGATAADRISSYLSLVQHVESLWLDAVALYERRRFAAAAFFAIVSLEETGKLAATKLSLAGFPALAASSPLQRSKDPFFQHSKKHQLAAFGGALINSRLVRLLGVARVASFLKDAETGKLERFRQDCLYLAYDRSGPVLPSAVVSSSLAALHIVVSGEVIAESLGFPDSEWVRLLASVTDTENRLGLLDLLQSDPPATVG